MLKLISLLAAISFICAFAKDPVPEVPATEIAPVAEVHAKEATSVAEVPEGEPVATDTTQTTHTTEAVPEAPAEQAQIAATPEQAPSPVAVEAPSSPAKEAIIENPVEFIIVSVVFIATVLLIALTGN